MSGVFVCNASIYLEKIVFTLVISVSQIVQDVTTNGKTMCYLWKNLYHPQKYYNRKEQEFVVAVTQEN